jgi:hypothetical protein
MMGLIPAASASHAMSMQTVTLVKNPNWLTLSFIQTALEEFMVWPVNAAKEFPPRYGTRGTACAYQIARGCGKRNETP